MGGNGLMLETESVGPEFEFSTRIIKVGMGQANQ